MIDVVSTVEFQISLLLFIALLGYFIAARIGQSIIIGQILVGIAVGPSVFGLITYTDFIAKLATMGAIFLLFAVGLQTKFKEIYNIRPFVIALLGVIIPWVGGFWIAHMFGYPLGEAVFIGTTLTATSIAITAQVLKEMGRMDSAAAKAIIGAAVLDDVLALLALGLTQEFIGGDISWANVAYSGIVALVFLAAGIFIGMNLINPQLERFNRWAQKHNVEKATFIGAVAFAFLYALAAQIAGLSAIVGAFIAGVSLESLHIKSYKEGAEYVEAIFAAIFFISLGVLVDLKVAAGAGPFLAALTVVAMLTKLTGGWIGAKLTGLKADESLAVGLGMMPRGEIAIIAALIGLTTRIIGQEIYAAILAMSIITTVAAPAFLQMAFQKNSKSGQALDK